MKGIVLFLLFLLINTSSFSQNLDSILIRDSIHSDSVKPSIKKGNVIWQPKIEEAFHQSGKIVLKICVNAEGDVISTEFVPQNSTSNDEELIRIAKKNALAYKFSKAEVEKQCGTLTYVFKVEE